MKQFFRFLTVGVFNTLLGYCIIFACMYLAKMTPESSNAAGYGFGLFVSYFLHRNFTFKSKQRKIDEVTPFLVVFLIAYATNFVVLLFLIHKLNLNEGLSQVLAGIVYVATSFIMNKYYVFNFANNYHFFQNMRNLTLNRYGFALYSAVVMVAFINWVVGSPGLGPIDDHHFIRTIFQGKEFGAYIMPELGRFFPLVAQEYVVAAKLFEPSAQMFYLINAFKIVLCGSFLFFCLILTGLGSFASAILWTSVIFSMGIANTLFRLSAGEFNALILILLFIWSVLMVQDRQKSAVHGKVGFEIIGVFAFFLALFYKELIFVFGIVFSFSEIVRAYWIKKSKPSVFIVLILSFSLLYIVTYGIWRFIYVTGSYADFHAISLGDVLSLFANNDPLIVFVLLPVTTYRVVAILCRSERYSIYDSFLFAASAYTCAFMLLAMFNTYYLLPVYAFFICGLAGILARNCHIILQRIILAFVLLLSINIFPVALSDIQAQKMIVHNHFPFVRFLSEWLWKNPLPNSEHRSLVLNGVSPGNGIEVITSLKIFLESFGVQDSSFEVKSTEPSDNKAISSFYGVKDELGYTAKIGDLLIFNPYQQIVSYPPLLVPSYSEVYRSGSEWALPRWTGWDWMKICVFTQHNCASKISANMRYTGYAALLVNRMIAPIQLVPLKSPSYRIGPLMLPSPMRAGITQKLDVLIENTGEETWPTNGALGSGMFVNLAYVWINENGQVALEGGRASFSEPMQPNDKAKVSVILKTPVKTGKYKLVISPVQEGVRWFYLDNDINTAKVIEIL